MKKIIITGATSFLGRNLIKSLIKGDYIIYALVRKNSLNPLKIKSKNLKYIYASLDEIETIYNYISKADIFIHFAWDGSGSIGRSDEIIQMKNVSYSLKALEIAIKLGCEKFIFPGSQAEYGKKYELITETSQCNPISFYGKAKLMFSQKAKKRCKNEKIKFIHLRIFSVYGFDDREGTLVNSCITSFNNNQTIKLGPCTQKWNYLYILDFVNIVISLIESNCLSGIYNIASPETKILKEFVKIIYELSNKTGSYEFDEKLLTNPEGSPNLDPSIEKVKTYLNEQYNFIPFSKGIKLIMKKMSDSYESTSAQK